MGRQLTGVGVYSRELLRALAAQHPEARHLWCYRPHRFRQAWQLEKAAAAMLPKSVHRRLLYGPFTPTGADLFHGLNQRLPETQRFRRSVCTFHDLFVLTGEYSTAEFRARFTQQAQDAAARADLLIAVSQFTADQIASLLHIPAARVRVVPHGIHVPAGVTPLTQREPLLLHVGAIQHRKNISRLLAAFARLKEPWRLVLAGSFGYGEEELRGEIERHPRRDAIEVLGYVTDADLSSLYSRARLLVFPSLDEGFGIPVLEAMGHGLPVLTSNRSALPEVSGGAAKLVDPYSIDEITAGMESMLEKSHEAAEEQIVRGRRWAAAHTWANAAARTWQVYQELLLT